MLLEPWQALLVLIAIFCLLYLLSKSRNVAQFQLPLRQQEAADAYDQEVDGDGLQRLGHDDQGRLGLFNANKPDVAQLARSQDIEGLMAALRYDGGPKIVDSNRIRCEAAKALAELADPRAVEVLRKELQAAEKDLGDLREVSGLGSLNLLPDLRREYQEISESLMALKGHLAEALRKCTQSAAPCSVPPASGMAAGETSGSSKPAEGGDDAPEEQTEVLEALATFREEEARTAAQAEKARLDAVGARTARASVNELVGMLKDGEAAEAIRAGSELATRANALGDAVMAPMIAAFGDEGMRGRYRMLKASGQWRDSDAGLFVLELTRAVLAGRGFRV